jgi:HSP20 family protein
MLSFPEVNELTDDVRRVFEEFDRLHRPGCRVPSSVYTPALDVLQSDTQFEVVVDLPGVSPDDVRVLFKQGAVIVVGEKLEADPCAPNTTAFHLVERSFGRFARVVRLPEAVDAASAQAVFTAGELRIAVPRIPERRGREIAVPIRVASRADDDPPSGRG